MGFHSQVKRQSLEMQEKRSEWEEFSLTWLEAPVNNESAKKHNMNVLQAEGIVLNSKT